MPHFKLACLLSAGFAAGFPYQAAAQQSPADEIQAGYEQRGREQPRSSELFFEMATVYWDAAYRGRAMLTTDQKRELIARGVVSVDRALTLRPNYREALIYKNLLLRLQARIETDPERQQALIREADELRERAGPSPR